MIFKQYINEMGDIIQLDNGSDINKSNLKKFKKKLQDVDRFISHIQTKYKLSDGDIRRLKAAYKEI